MQRKLSIIVIQNRKNISLCYGSCNIGEFMIKCIDQFFKSFIYFRADIFCSTLNSVTAHIDNSLFQGIFKVDFSISALVTHFNAFSCLNLLILVKISACTACHIFFNLFCTHKLINKRSFLRQDNKYNIILS